VERYRCIFGDKRSICLVLGQNTAGEVEVVQSLAAGLPRCACQDDLRLGLRRDISGQLALSVEFGSTLGGGYALDAARVCELETIGCKPSFTSL
jgi:hypothetical protein